MNPALDPNTASEVSGDAALAGDTADDSDCGPTDEESDSPPPTKSQKRARQRKRKLDATDPNRQKRGAAHIANSTAWTSSNFDGPKAIHAKDGFIGKNDCGKDYAFLKGSYGEQMEQLADRDYTELDPPPE